MPAAPRRPATRALLAALFVALVAGVVVGPGVAASALTGQAPVTTAARGYVPAPAVAEGDSPLVYYNGCHQGSRSIRPVACAFGPRGVERSVLLLGDSHAAHWFSAVQATATAKRWRLLSITKSGCPAADLAVTRYKGSARYVECPVWRRNVFTALRRGQYGMVDVLVMSSWSGHGVFASPRAGRLYDADRYAEWEKATVRTLSVVTRFARQVVILRDSPDMPVDQATFDRCMRVNVRRPYKCGAPAAKALDGHIWAAERRAASLYPNVATVDLSRPLCSGGYCPTVVDGVRMLKDDNHFTNTFVARVMTPRLRPVLVDAMTRATTPTPAPTTPPPAPTDSPAPTTPVSPPPEPTSPTSTSPTTAPTTPVTSTTSSTSSPSTSSSSPAT